MARLTKADAARQLGISRTTLYKLIDQGAISSTADGLIDSTELVRAAPFVDRLKHHSQTPSDTRQTSANTREMDTQRHGERHLESLADRDDERPQTSGDERPKTYADMVVDLLREQLRKAQEDAQREREAGQERERAYREHIAHLTVMLDQAHQQNQRLLEAPRPPPAPPVTPTPGVSAPSFVPSEPLPSRSTVRQRILAVLREYPEGLSAVELRGLLRADRSLTDTCAGMFKDGLLRRVGRGRYVMA